MKKLLTLAACLTLSSLLNAQTIIFVKPNGTGDGTSWANACSLENAVTIAVSGDQIWVQRGTYTSSKMLVVPTSVKVYGGFIGTETTLPQHDFVAALTVIDAQKKFGPVFRLEKSAEINGFTIQNGNANDKPQKNGGGVWTAENCMIENCKIVDNTAMLNGGGVYASGKIKILNSMVKNNTATGDGQDIFGSCVTMNGELIEALSIVGCSENIFDFGEVSFKTQTTVNVTAGGITLTWSDVVVAEGCNKSTYYGSVSGSFYSDCRAQNPATYGNLFSWCAVARFARILCPSPWRVPTVADFGILDRAMGGYGDGSGPSPNGTARTDAWGKYYWNSAIRNNYLNIWKGLYVGEGDPATQGTLASFWTYPEYNATEGFYSGYNANGSVRPQGHFSKSYSCALRCVK